MPFPVAPLWSLSAVVSLSLAEKEGCLLITSGVQPYHDEEDHSRRKYQQPHLDYEQADGLQHQVGSHGHV